MLERASVIIILGLLLLMGLKVIKTVFKVVVKIIAFVLIGIGLLMLLGYI